MAIKRKQDLKQTQYFCTFTCYGWLPLFEKTNLYDAIYKWFDYMKENYENEITGYVIMPNHIHLMVYVTEKSPIINKVIANGKRFLAYEIVKKLEEKSQINILKKLQKGVSPSEGKRGKLHQVFEPSSDIKRCVLYKFIWQKLDYMHNNPKTGKWNLVELNTDYEHSSARYYILGEHASYRVKDYHQLGMD